MIREETRQRPQLRGRFRLEFRRVVPKTLQGPCGVGTQIGEVRGLDRHTFKFEGMECLCLIHNILQRHSICHQFIVDNRFLLVRWIVRLQEALTAKSQAFGEAVVPLNLGRAFMHRAAHRIVANPRLVRTATPSSWSASAKRFRELKLLIRASTAEGMLGNSLSDVPIGALPLP